MRKIALQLFFAAAIISGFAWIADNPRTEKEGTENEANEQNAIAGASKYWDMLRKNIVTGMVDPNDYYKAIAQANATFGNTAKRSKAAGLGLQWTSLGPTNIGGRTRAILFDKNNHNHVFAGGVAGGLWESNDLAQTWHRIAQSDSLQNMCVTGIAQAANGDIYFTTGELNGSDLVAQFNNFGGGKGFPGYGMWKSTDGGATFRHLPATTPAANGTGSPWNYTDAVACDPNDANTLFVATQSGLYKSTDAGQSFNHFLSNGGWCTDVRYSADGSSVATFFANSSNLYLSTDGGQSFLPTSLTDSANGTIISATRAKIAFAPSNSKYIYVSTVGGSANVLRSTDGGSVWNVISPLNSAGFTAGLYNQGTYSMSIAVVPDNPNLIYTGGLDLYQWNGATSQWNNVSSWFYPRYASNYVHADHHAVVFDPTNPNTFLTGTDGGISICANAHSAIPTFNERNKGYGVTQLYGIGAGFNGNWCGGAQDNGSFLNDYTNLYSGYVKTVYGGDGFEAAYSHLDTLLNFVSTYGDASQPNSHPLGRSTNGGNNYSDCFDIHIDPNSDGHPDENGFFTTRMYLWEDEDSVLPIAYKNSRSRLFFPTANGVWMTANPTGAPPTWCKLTSGGLIPNALSFKMTHDGNTLFVGDENGNLWRIDSLNLNYPPLTYTGNFLSLPVAHQVHTTKIYNGSQVVTGITIDPADNNNVIISLANYGASNHLVRISNAMTTTATSTTISTNAQGNLPAMPCYSIDINPLNRVQAVVATEFGVYSTSNIWAGSPTWNDENATFPRMPTMQVFFSKNYTYDAQGGIHPNKYWLFASTHGRGAWYTNTLCVGCDSINTSKGFVLGIANVEKEQVKVYPNPASSYTTVELSSDFSNATIQVYNLNGQMLMDKKNVNNHETINMADWNAGTYIISIQANGKTINKKIIKI